MPVAGRHVLSFRHGRCRHAITRLRRRFATPLVYAAILSPDVCYARICHLRHAQRAPMLPPARAARRLHFA